MLNDGAYPEKSTLNFFVDPLGVTGFRLHLLLLGLAVIVLTLLKVQPTGRMVRGLGWGITIVAVINGAYITVKGGGLGAITAADGVAFGAIVTLVGGIAAIVGGVAGGLGERPTLSWRLPWWVEWIVLLVVFVIVLFLVAAVLTSGGQGGVVNAYAGAVFLSLLGALGGAFAALSASGLLGWISTVSERHRTFSVVVLLAMALGLPLTAAGTEYWMTVAANIGVYAATAIGLNIVVGLAGLLDLGYVAFLGIGAFTAANLSGAAASKVGIAAAVPDRHGHLRGGGGLLRRDRRLADPAGARRLPRHRHARLRRDLHPRRAEQHRRPHRRRERDPEHPAGGAVRYGVQRVDHIGAIRLPSGVLYYVLIVLLVAFVMLVFAHLKDSRLGRAWIAIREDEDAARAMGVRTGPIKILAFLTGAMLAGLAGAFFAHKTAVVAYDSFRFTESVTLLAAVILGGMGTIPGAVLGASILFILPEKLREFADYRLLLFGLGLIVLMRLRPQGLIADRHRAAELAGEPEPHAPVEDEPKEKAEVPA